MGYNKIGPEERKRRIDEKINTLNETKKAMVLEFQEKVLGEDLQLRTEKSVNWLIKQLKKGTHMFLKDGQLTAELSTSIRNHIIAKDKKKWEEMGRRVGLTGEDFKQRYLKEKLIQLGKRDGKGWSNIFKTEGEIELKEKVLRALEYKMLEKYKNEDAKYQEERRNAIQFTRNDNLEGLQRELDNMGLKIDASKVRMQVRVYAKKAGDDEEEAASLEYEDSETIRKRYDKGLANSGEIWVNILNEKGDFTGLAVKVSDGRIKEYRKFNHKWWEEEDMQ